MKIQRVDALPLQLRFTESAVAVLGGDRSGRPWLLLAEKRAYS